MMKTNMKYLKTFENYNKSEFIIDLESIPTKDERGYYKLIDILKENKQNLNNFLDKIRIILIQNEIANELTTFKLLGTGEFGIAFGFDDKVVKITTSDSEFKTSEKLLNLELLNVVKYHLSFQYQNLPIWIIVQDKLDMLPQKEKDVYTTLYYLGANDINDKNFKYKDLNELFLALKNRLKNPNPEDELPSYDIDDSELKVYFDKYLDLAKNLREQDISTDDLHGENIGIKDSELVHFDVMIIE